MVTLSTGKKIDGGMVVVVTLADAKKICGETVGVATVPHKEDMDADVDVVEDHLDSMTTACVKYARKKAMPHPHVGGAMDGAKVVSIPSCHHHRLPRPSKFASSPSLPLRGGIVA
jgi:hypothetical protein